MRPLLFGLAIFVLPVAAFAQGGAPGGGGMGGGGGGRHGGGMGGGRSGGGGEKRSMGGESRRPEMRPISREKMDKPVEEMFRAADTDKDGFVTFDELRAVLNAKREVVIHERFKKIDANGDRLIDEREFVAWQESMGSVALSDSESRGTAIAIVPDVLAPSLGKSGDGQALAIIIEPLSVTVLASANTNYDKGVTLAELLAYEHARFDGADADKDGMLSGAELRSLESNDRFPGGRGARPAESGGTAQPVAGDDSSD